MAQYGKLSGTVTDNQGNPISGATVEVRRQGAFVTSTQAGPTYTVDDPGGIEVSDQVRPNALSAPSRNVSAVTATSVTTSGPGLGTLNNNDRISIFSALPTLYADPQAGETKANPLTTDASGYWFCWVQIRPYDIIETYGSTVRLKTDIVPEGQEFVQSNVFSAAGAIAFRHGTTRTITAGKLLALENPILVTEKYSVDYAGNIVSAGNLTAVNGTFTGTLGVTGNVSFTGDLTVDDITADDISIGDLTVSGAVSLPAGSLETADLATQATMITRTADGTADQALTAGNPYTDITNCTLTFTPFSSSSEIVIIATAVGEPTGAAANLFGAIRDGSSNSLHEGSQATPGTANKAAVIPLIYRVTGLTGSQTFKLSMKCEVNNCTSNNATNAAAMRVCRIIAMEFKR